MRIGTLAKQAGIKPSAIRFYEANGLLPASRRGLNGYRDYGPEALRRLQFIQLAQRLGFSLESLRGALADGQGAWSKTRILQELERRRGEIARLQQDLAAQDTELLRLMAECQQQWARGQCVQLVRQGLAGQDPADKPDPQAIEADLPRSP